MASFLDALLTPGGAGAEAGALTTIVVDDVPTPVTGVKLFHESIQDALYWKHPSGRVLPVAPSNAVHVASCVPIGEVLTADNFEYALNAAIEYVDALPRCGAVLIPPGDWNMTAEVLLLGHGYTKPSVRLVGAGKDATRLIWPNGYTGNCIRLEGYQDNPEGFATSPYWMGGIFDLTIYTANDNGRAVGIYMRQTIWTPIVRVNVRGFGNPENNGRTRGVGVWMYGGNAVGEGNHQHPCFFDTVIGGCTTGFRVNSAFPINMYKVEFNQNRFTDWLLGGVVTVQMDGGMFQSIGDGGNVTSPYMSNPYYSVRMDGEAVRNGTGATVSAQSSGVWTVTNLSSCVPSDAGKSLVLDGSGASKDNGMFLITEYVGPTSLKIQKANGAGATGQTWTVHQNDGDLYAKLEGVIYHEGAMGAMVMLRKAAAGLVQVHIDGIAVHNLTTFVNIEHVDDFTARRLIGYPPTVWCRARSCKRLLFEVPETPETDPTRWDLDLPSRNALVVMGRAAVSVPSTPYNLEELLRRKRGEWFDLSVNAVVASDGTLTSVRGLFGSVANATTNKPEYIAAHPRLGGRPAVALRNAGTRNMHGTFAVPIPVGTVPSIIVVGHLPAGANSGIGDRRLPAAYDNGTRYNHCGAAAYDASGDATGVKILWRDPNTGAYSVLRRDIDFATGRIIVIGTWLGYTASESVYVEMLASETDSSNGNATAWYDLMKTIAAMTHFQFCGELGNPTTSANDFDLAAVGWLEMPLHPDELLPTMRALQARWGRDTMPALLANNTPIGVNGQVIPVDLSSADQTVALPAGHRRGDRIEVQVITAASGHTCTIDPSGAQTINGAATLVLSADYDGAELVSDGTNWIRRKR